MFRKISFYILIFIAFSLVSFGFSQKTTSASTVTITSPTAGQTFGGGTITITGTATAGKIVTVKIDGISIGTVTATGGNWSISATNVAAGSHSIVAEVTDGPYLYVTVQGKITIYDTNNMSLVSAINDDIGSNFVVDQINNRLYGAGDGTIKVVDMTTNSVIATINVGNFPTALELNPDRSKLYVANYMANTISIIDTSTNTLTNTINLVTHGEYYTGIGFGNNNKAYIGSIGSWQGFTVIDTSTELESGSIPIAGTAIGTMTTSPIGDRIYYGSQIAPSINQISIFNTSSESVVGNIGVANFPSPIVLNPSGSKMYVGDSVLHTITVYDTSTYQVIQGPLQLTTTDGFGGFVYSEFDDSIYFTTRASGGDFTSSQIGKFSLASLVESYTETNSGTGVYFGNGSSITNSSAVVASNNVGINMNSVSINGLPRVGMYFGMPVALAIIVTFGFVYVDYRHHRFALQVGASGELPVYTFQNHVRYVTIPRVSYRLAEQFSSQIRKL